MKSLLRGLIILSLLLYSTHLTARAPDRLVIGMTQEPNLLNPLISQMRSAGYVGNFLFSYFVRYDDRMNLIPDLITEVPTRQNGGISKDNLTYTYHLRKNARWHDGRPLTSADIRFTYELIMNPRVNIPSRQGWEKIKSLRTPDAHTVIFTLKEPYVNFVGDTFFEEPVLPKHLLQGKIKNFSALPYHQKPVGSGPYILEKWDHGSHIQLRANKNYYRTTPALKTIILKFIPSQQMMLVQLQTGEIDAAEGVTTTEVQTASKIKGIKIYQSPTLTYEHITFNLQAEVMKYPEIRKAVALAVNRDDISEKVYQSIWTPCYSPFLEESPYHKPGVRKALAYNPALAKKILEQNGWVDKNKDGVREKKREILRLQITSTSGRNLRVMTEEVIQQQLKKIGIDLTIKNYISSVLFNFKGDGGILEQGKFQMALFSWHSSPDPSILENLFSKNFLPNRGQNFARIHHNKLTSLLEKGAVTMNLPERTRIYHQVSDILVEELPILPLLRSVKVLAFPKALKNVKPNPTQIGTSWNCHEWTFKETIKKTGDKKRDAVKTLKRKD